MEKKLKSYSVGDQESSEQTVGNLTALPNPAVRAVALGHSKIAAGTKSGEILEIDKSGNIRVLTKVYCQQYLINVNDSMLTILLKFIADLSSLTYAFPKRRLGLKVICAIF